MTIKTVLGDAELTGGCCTLAHEHICCYSEFLRMMSGGYIDMRALEESAVSVLSGLKKTRGLELFVDCTPVNIGRNVELLRAVAEKSGVMIACSTGFYYQDEPVLEGTEPRRLAEYMIEDAKSINAALIKAAVEKAEITPFNRKLLEATAMAQRALNLPIVLHTNAGNQNGRESVRLLMEGGVPAQKICVAHLSDTQDDAYIRSFAEMGCYVALDRLYGSTEEAYIEEKCRQIMALCDAGFEKQILLSHDDSLFNGFLAEPRIKTPRFDYVFGYILPRLDRALAEQIMCDNPIEFLCGEGISASIAGGV